MTWTYYEDFEIGETLDLGTYTVSEDEIVEFAERYDPQSFHLDREAASESIFGGLVTSGIQTIAIAQRLTVDGLLADAASLGSPGLEETEFRNPVYAGDTLRGTIEPIAKRELESRPDRGLVTFVYRLENQDGDVVLRMVTKIMFGRESST